MRLRLFIVGLFVVGGMAASANAALVSITSVNAVSTPVYDLTNVYGLDDWAYWAQTADPITGSPVLPTNEKLGASLIGGITTVGGGNVRGTTANGPPIYSFAFADGTTPLNDTVSSLPGVFNTQLGSGGVGKGIELTVTAPSADPFYVYLWGTAFQATASLTATVGTATDTDSSYVGGDSRAPGQFYTIHVTPDNAGQAVNLQLLMSAQTNGNANVSISAVAISTIPEPGTMALLLGGGVLGLHILQRRRAVAAQC